MGTLGSRQRMYAVILEYSSVNPPMTGTCNCSYRMLAVAREPSRCWLVVVVDVDTSERTISVSDKSLNLVVVPGQPSASVSVARPQPWVSVFTAPYMYVCYVYVIYIYTMF